MADLPPSRQSGEERIDPGRGSADGTPRWVKLFGLAVLVLVLLFVVVTLVGGGEHGPDRHAPGDGSATGGSHTGPPPGFEHGDQTP